MTPEHSKENLPATYGGPGWQTREQTLAEEIAVGRLWHPCGCTSEWQPLKEVILHLPGRELDFSEDPDRMLMREKPALASIRQQAKEVAAIYQAEGITVHFTELAGRPPANFLFQRDLFWATPQGVVLARPAARQRAGEERYMAKVLAELEVPIIFHPHGRGTFEGADALWLDERTVLVGTGIRTNREGAAQLHGLLANMDVELLETPLSEGCQHLLGVINFVDRGLAVVNGARATSQLTGLLDRRGVRQIVLPRNQELTEGLGMNFVTLAPRRILMPAGCPGIRMRLQQSGLTVLEAEISEYRKAAGGVACLTGILLRDQSVMA